VKAQGGLITRRDLSEYRVVRRRPVTAESTEARVPLEPPPSSGGVLIAYGLRELEPRNGNPGTRKQCRGSGGDASANGTAQAERSCRRCTEAAWRNACCPERRTSRLVTATAMQQACRRRWAQLGMVVPGTGIHLNNMLGEYDLAGPVESRLAPDIDDGPVSRPPRGPNRAW